MSEVELLYLLLFGGRMGAGIVRSFAWRVFWTPRSGRLRRILNDSHFFAPTSRKKVWKLKQ